MRALFYSSHFPGLLDLDFEAVSFLFFLFMKSKKRSKVGSGVLDTSPTPRTSLDTEVVVIVYCYA